ncbi:MAG: DGQHR domain-containing protein [Flavobacteriaceae bacterium]|nr:DGQHR domain-containing protein [Flavobacteriaceae bacterium]
MTNITLNTIKVQQPIGQIYVAKISPEKLLAMSVVDRRRIAEDDEILGIQRELREDKVKQIKSYLSSIDATFPNSIIVNTTSDFIENETLNELTLKIDDSTFTIIDGQHRVEGFRDNQKDNFELIVAIFKDLKLDQQANIFSTINSQQTKVDPSLNLNLELNSKYYTPTKMMIEVAQSLNFDKDSPWNNNIRVLGSQTGKYPKGIISLSAFVKPLINLTFPEKDYYEIRNALIDSYPEFPQFDNFNYKLERYLFWEFYKRKDFESIYKILFNFFSALSILLNKDWLNERSLLNKTTGYSAQMKLFQDIIKIGINEGDLSKDFFFDLLKPINKMNGTITSENYGASGLKASNELYLEMKKTLVNIV